MRADPTPAAVAAVRATDQRRLALAVRGFAPEAAAFARGACEDDADTAEVARVEAALAAVPREGPTDLRFARLVRCLWGPEAEVVGELVECRAAQVSQALAGIQHCTLYFGWPFPMPDFGAVLRPFEAARHRFLRLDGRVVDRAERWAFGGEQYEAVFGIADPHLERIALLYHGASPA